MYCINHNSTEHHPELTKASPMVPLKQFVSDGYFFSIIIEYFVLINTRKLQYNYCCTKLKIVWIKITTFFKRRISIIL